VPKIYLPLASAEAYGAIGEMIVFQGQTCRAYVVPFDPRTDAQIDVREIFYDVTKMESFVGAWAKAAWRTAFGSRWYTSLYKRVTENGRERFNEAAGLWASMSDPLQEDWNNAAPFQVTYNAPGLVFFALAYISRAWLAEKGAPFFDMPDVTETSAGAVAAWFGRGLDGALLSGDWDDSNGLIVYSGTWGAVADTLASGGSYHQSSASGADSVSFYFYGSQISAEYVASPGAGGITISTFGMGDQTISQSAESVLYGQVWTSAALIKGLHLVTLTRAGAGAVTLDALGVLTTAKTSAAVLVSDAVALPMVMLSKNAEQIVMVGELTNVLWDAVADKQGMHSPVVNPHAVTVPVEGFYSVSFGLSYYGVYFTTPSFAYLQVNGEISEVVQFPELSTFFSHTTNLYLKAGDKLSVAVIAWGNVGESSITLLARAQTRVPFFDVFLLQRETLKIEAVHLTQQTGASLHSDLTGLDSDDHPQYLTQARGDARYLQDVPVLPHSGLSGLDSDDHPQYLTQARGDGLYMPLTGGGWQTYSPTWYGFSTAVSDVYAAYLVIGKICYVYVQSTGGTSNTTYLRLSLPVPAVQVAIALAYPFAVRVKNAGILLAAAGYLAVSVSYQQAFVYRDWGGGAFQTSGVKALVSASFYYPVD